MRVCIIGWYGTETIGDRAILAGIMAFLADRFSDFTVSLGSLYPFFSERTNSEDAGLWEELAGRPIEVHVFDSTKPSILKQAIRRSDLLLVGGGPLMDLREMHMLAFAFRYARRRQVRTGVFGCGVGPLNKPSYQKAAATILSHADFVVFRDSLSMAEARRLGFRETCKWTSAIDPAAYCAMRYLERTGPVDRNKQIIINMREISWEYEHIGGAADFESFAVDLVKKVMEDNPDCKVLLVPHHYFFFGGDDRMFLNSVKYRLGSRELMVQNQALSLRRTMEVFHAGSCCVGMRFHAMLLMTLLNGRCRIINYTGGAQGKIRGFLDDFDLNGYFDSSRLLSLDSEALDVSLVAGMQKDVPFEAPSDALKDAFDTYRSALA